MLKLRTAEDIQALPAYIAKVDPKRTPLIRIVEHYYIRPFEIACALCGKAHMDGYIVEVDAGSSKGATNIGHICGKRFGERYSEARQRFDESQRKPDLIRRVVNAKGKLSALHFQIEEYRHRASALLQREANFSRIFPDLHKELLRRAINNRPQVSVSVELSEEEIDEAKAANPFKTRDELRFREEFKGTIRGYKFLSYNWSYGGGLRKLFGETSTFMELNSRSMSMQELTKWANWSDDLEEALATLDSAINEGEAFFSSENFQLFQYLPATPNTSNLLKSFTLATLDKMPVREEAPLAAPAKRAQQVAQPSRSTLSAKEWRRLTGNKRAW